MNYHPSFGMIGQILQLTSPSRLYKVGLANQSIYLYSNMLNWLLPIAFAVLAVFTLVKDWTAYKKSWRRLVILGVIVATGIGGAINNWIRDEDVRVQTDKLRGEIVGLKASVEIAQRSQEDNTKQFVQAFGKISEKVSDLQSQVKTEGLKRGG